MNAPAPETTTDLLITLADRMAALLRERAAGPDDLALPLLDAYTCASQHHALVADHIQAFNRAISAGFTHNDPAPLQPMVSPAGFQRILQNFTRWRQGGTRALLLEECQVLWVGQPSTQEPLTASALALETWSFVSADGTDRHEPSLNLYALVRDPAGWKIDRVQFYTQG